MRPLVDQAEYERAAELWPTKLAAMARNIAVAPNWLGSEEKFWFREELADGARFVTVDAATGKRLATTDQPPELAADPAFEPGPRGRALFLRGFDLWLREPDGRERPLTDDGEAACAWSAMPDYDLKAVARSRGLARSLPTGCFWSPKGNRVLTFRTDEQSVEPYPYVEFVPADGAARPRLHWVRLQMFGEAAAPRRDWFIIDVDTCARTPLTLPEDWGELEIEAWANGGAFWSPQGDRAWVLAVTPDNRRAALAEIAADTGRMHIVHEERVDTFFDFNTLQYALPNVRLLADRKEMIWYSQADGWGHLYAIDLNRGGISRRLTEGPWAVFDILGVTDEHIFFTAGGREPGRNPYYRHLYRIDVGAEGANAGLKLLTPEDADHALEASPTPIIAQIRGAPAGRTAMSPSCRYFVDCFSRVDLPPVTVIRDAEGGLVAEVARADIDELEASGWRPPEIFNAKAADGVTDVWGVLVKPRDFEARECWPVVERIYAGPQMIAQPRSFAEGLIQGHMYGAWSMAELGLVVAVLDGPGTPYRSKQFHDQTWDQADRAGVAHHRAALVSAAATRPWMDLSRVGICGHSYGGYATAMALLLEPDFYKVGVSSAGMYDPMYSAAFTPLRHLGHPDFGGGRRVRTVPGEPALNFLKFSPSSYADNLVGRLMLAWGDLDENVQAAGLLQFADALVRAGKSYDMLYLAGRSHAFFAEAYFHKRTWDYLIEHVQGREPLVHLSLPALSPPVRGQMTTSTSLSQANAEKAANQDVRIVGQATHLGAATESRRARAGKGDR